MSERDMIVEVNGDAVSSAAEIEERLSQIQEGATVELTVETEVDKWKQKTG
eukprot:COSAG01_NODE_33793_length_558_cov_1.352941_1_plen_50_part_10